MKDAQNYYIKGNKSNFNGYKIQMKKNGNKLNNIRRETTKYFRKKEGISERQK
jgi:hypothetical protein